MKKLIAIALVAAMFLSPLMSTAQAVEPIRNNVTNEKQLTEGGRGRYDHRRGRRRGRGGSSGAAIAGASILGALIIGGMIAGSKSKKSQQPQMYCDQYGNCWYQ